MKQFLFALLALIGSAIVTIVYLPLGFLYSIGYGIWLKRRGNQWTALFRYAWRIVDGTFCAFAHIIHWGLAYGLDLLWNVHGELIEDAVTHEDDTTFGEKDISVSASIGKLEIDGKLNKTGRIFSKVLNFVFWQKQHAKDAWLFLQARIELRKKYFEKL